MRTLRDLDDEIGRAERRLQARREHLNESLSTSRVRTRVSLGSPRMLLAAFAVGFVLERLGRMRPRRSAQAGQAGTGAGIAAGLAAAALRAGLSNPKLWEAVRSAWSRRADSKLARTQASSPVPAPYAAPPLAAVPETGARHVAGSGADMDAELAHKAGAYDYASSSGTSAHR
jgi:hypothetical protein